MSMRVLTICKLFLTALRRGTHFCFLLGTIFTLILPSSARAEASCTNLVASVSPSAPSAIVVGPSVEGSTLFTGTYTITGSGCSGMQTGKVYLPIGDAYKPLTGLPGVNTRVNPPGTAPTTSGTCVIASTVAWDTYRYITFGTRAGFCSFTFSVPFSIVLAIAGGTYLGTTSATSLTEALTTDAVTRINWGLLTPGTFSKNADAPAGFRPTFVAGSCTLSASVIAVTLPPVSTADLDTAGKVAGAKNFPITLTNCSYNAAAYDINATWSFTPGQAMTNVENTGTSKYVEVQLLDGSGVVIQSGGSSKLGRVSAAGTSINAVHSARYVATGRATGGSVTATAMFTLSYP